MMSETISAATVAAALKRGAVTLTQEAGRLNDLDQLMGDGDIGITLEKIGIALTEYADSPLDETGDIGKWLGKAGMAANKAGSSSYGTLLATALMRAGKAVSGKSELTATDLAEMFSAANLGVQERGKAQLGDKTVVDALHPAAAFAYALGAGSTAEEAGRAALLAAEVGRDSVTPSRSRIGRASWVGERTEGKVDPGCEAFVVILRALIQP